MVPDSLLRISLVRFTSGKGAESYVSFFPDLVVMVICGMVMIYVNSSEFADVVISMTTISLSNFFIDSSLSGVTNFPDESMISMVAGLSSDSIR